MSFIWCNNIIQKHKQFTLTTFEFYNKHKGIKHFIKDNKGIVNQQTKSIKWDTLKSNILTNQYTYTELTECNSRCPIKLSTHCIYI